MVVALMPRVMQMMKYGMMRLPMLFVAFVHSLAAVTTAVQLYSGGARSAPLFHTSSVLNVIPLLPP
jgi:hypothetical protein